MTGHNAGDDGSPGRGTSGRDKNAAFRDATPVLDGQSSIDELFTEPSPTDKQGYLF